ncbi:MAG TPA: RIP metalloprotease RseP [Candidatus Dormibacteraeota bacterium]|nr:RIP metalloprotease RseP [Candidatus Dormibacteraeota bacterium]
MGSVLSLFIGIVLVLGTMILVHEYGHFLAARLCGVRVEVFSIGFGPRLFGWRRGDTDYRLSALPLGGYVRMAGQDLSENRTGAPDELLSKTRWQRALIALAGPVVNLIMPFLLLGGFFIAIGVPYESFEDRPVEVIALAKNSPLATAGLQIGDRLVEINGIQNPSWEKALNAAAQAGPASELHVVVEKDGKRRTLTLPPAKPTQSDWPFGYVPIPPVVDQAVPGLPAQRAGMRSGDRVISVNGQQIATWLEFVDAIKHSNGQPILVKVRRGVSDLNLTIEPQQNMNDRGEPVYQIGVQVQEDTTYRREGTLKSLELAGRATANGARQVVGVVGKLFSGKVSVRQLQSVVGISRQAGLAVKKGPYEVIQLMALISLNLGILNLLPIPILDGGHILLLAIEGVMRRDLSTAFKERFVQVGFVFLLVIFAIVMYNDVLRILPSH